MVARIAVLGDRNHEFMTHRELDAALELFPQWAEVGWVATDDLQARKLDDINGIWVAPGGPYRDDAAVFSAIRHARERHVPMLGTCSGFQYAIVEFARAVAGLSAGHGELEPEHDHPVITALECSLVGQERLVTCVPRTRLAAICGTEPFVGFHWCRFGLADAFIERLMNCGLLICAHAPDAGVEAVELVGHPFFIATLFQPQIGSGAHRSVHPLIGAFIDAAGVHAASIVHRRPGW
jgi:CTP synthase (UTP-ammonia lyase)